MAYVVNTTLHADRDLAGLYQQVNAASSDTAMEWYFGDQSGHSQSGTAAEPLPDNARDKLRHLLYGHKPHVYRVIYRVLEKKKQVEVLHIRHGARRKLKPSDLV